MIYSLPGYEKALEFPVLLFYPRLVSSFFYKFLSANPFFLRIFGLRRSYFISNMSKKNFAISLNFRNFAPS